MSTRKGLVSRISEEQVVSPVIDDVGLFIPDQSLSIRDIIQRFAITGDVTGLQAQVDRGFDGDDSFDDDGFTDLASMDIAEVQELCERARQFLDDYARARNDVAKPVSPASPDGDGSGDGADA